MKVAVIGSRELHLEDFSEFLPAEVSEIVSGGARGIDRCAARYAKAHGLNLREFLPDYEQFGKRAPLLRNLEIIEYADLVLAFWDGESSGTRFVIENCKKTQTPIKVYQPKK